MADRHKLVGDIATFTTPEAEVCEFSVNGKNLTVRQQPGETQHCGAIVWDAAVVLLRYFEKNFGTGNAKKLKCKRVLELGSGCGLLGIGLSSMGCDCTITDQSSVIPNLKYNVLCNAELLEDSQGACAACELDWRNPSSSGLDSQSYDMVVGSDCVFEEELCQEVVRTIDMFLRPGGKAFFANEIRSQSVEDAFMQAAEQIFVVKKESAKRMKQGYSHPLVNIFILSRKA